MANRNDSIVARSFRKPGRGIYLPARAAPGYRDRVFRKAVAYRPGVSRLWRRITESSYCPPGIAGAFYAV